MDVLNMILFVTEIHIFMDIFWILSEYQKFVRRKSSVQSYEKPVVLKVSDDDY